MKVMINDQLRQATTVNQGKLDWKLMFSSDAGCTVFNWSAAFCLFVCLFGWLLVCFFDCLFVCLCKNKDFLAASASKLRSSSLILWARIKMIIFHLVYVPRMMKNSMGYLPGRCCRDEKCFKYIGCHTVTFYGGGISKSSLKSI